MDSIILVEIHKGDGILENMGKINKRDENPRY